MSSSLRRVCVYCGSRTGEDPAFADAARRLGSEIARRGLELVYGGASVGLMGIVADAVLAGLRRPGETGYKIPRGGLYELISCPNYFGELLEWLGWAIATWSVAGLSFAVFTAANLVPRALTHHRWYREKFPEYPRSRRAVVPFVL